eukprot:scaffold17478_cov27-Phaeocystis_antarctica.AAC.1
MAAVVVWKRRTCARLSHALTAAAWRRTSPSSVSSNTIRTGRCQCVAIGRIWCIMVGYITVYHGGFVVHHGGSWLIMAYRARPDHVGVL